MAAHAQHYRLSKERRSLLEQLQNNPTMGQLQELCNKLQTITKDWKLVRGVIGEAKAQAIDIAIEQDDVRALRSQLGETTKRLEELTAERDDLHALRSQLAETEKRLGETEKRLVDTAAERDDLRNQLHNSQDECLQQHFKILAQSDEIELLCASNSRLSTSLADLVSNWPQPTPSGGKSESQLQLLKHVPEMYGMGKGDIEIWAGQVEHFVCIGGGREGLSHEHQLIDAALRALQRDSYLRIAEDLFGEAAKVGFPLDLPADMTFRTFLNKLVSAYAAWQQLEPDAWSPKGRVGVLGLSQAPALNRQPYPRLAQSSYGSR